MLIFNYFRILRLSQKLLVQESHCKLTDEHSIREDVFISHLNCRGVQTELFNSLVRSDEKSCVINDCHVSGKVI